MFLLLDEPEVYGLPPDPVVTTRDLPDMWRKAALAAATLFAGAVAAFAGAAAMSTLPGGHAETDTIGRDGVQNFGEGRNAMPGTGAAG